MARKIRGKNEGSIQQRPNGTWRAQVTLQGRRLSYAAKTRRECQDWIKKTIHQIDDGMTYSNTRIILEEFLSGWLTSSKASKRRSTWAHYCQLVHNYVVPRIGQIKVKDLRPDQIQGLYNTLLSQGVGTYTVIKIHTTLHSALAHAVKTGIVGRNPASQTIPPKQPSKEMHIFEESQVNQMLVAAKGDRWEALYHLAVTTGMRQMELLGLKWSDLDWINQTIKVERQLVRPDGEGIQFAQPKTRLGKRTVVLGIKTIAVLRSHFERQHAKKKAGGEHWKEHGLLFTNSLGGPIHPRNLVRDFKQLLRDAGLPTIRFHDLRHTAASLMLNHGVPVIVVSRRLGHAKPSITLDVYGHLLSGMQNEAAELIDELITPIELHPTAPDLHPILPLEEPTPHI